MPASTKSRVRTGGRLDGRGRVDRYIYPELDEERVVYDARNRITELRRVAKPNSSPALNDIVITATWNNTWNRPSTIIDPRGFQTDFAYVPSGSGAGELQSVTRPNPAGAAPAITGTRPTYAFTYGAFGRVASTTDPTGLVVSNAIDPGNGNVTSTTLDPGVGHVNAVTSFGYDPIGNQLTATDPRGNATSTSYDNMRRPTLVRHHNGNSSANIIAAERTNYNLLGQVTSTEGGLSFTGTSVSTWLPRETRTYTPTGQIATVADGLNNTTTNAYDALDRLLSVTDPVGRVTRNEYDPAGQLTRVMRAHGTGLQQDYARYTYSANGQRLSVRDANNNRSFYVYDGFDRLCRVYFPVSTLDANAANLGTGGVEAAIRCGDAPRTGEDYEGYSYDPSNNRTSLRLRSSETISFNFDNLSRETIKDIPGGGGADVYTAYDLAGRRQSALFASTSGQGITYGYDTAGRLTSETSTIGTSRALSFQYDVASNRTRITWPDNFHATYTYDALSRVDLIQENGSTTLADYNYDPLSRRTTVTRGNGTVTTHSYDDASRLTSLDQNLAATANDQAYGFSFTAASQLSQRTASNDNYNWTVPTVSRSYDRNGLNQYSAVAGASFTYDPRGNLTRETTRSFCYDLENRLLNVAAAGAANCISPTLTLSYDPLGRLRQSSAASGTTDFIYDGDRLSTEYSGANITRRYVHGPGVDEPIVWYEGSGTSDRRYLITDHQGTAIAEDGASVVRYAYGPYGEPASWNGARFRYTGQAALPEAQLYHYKARVYDPVLGRFLQTDPIGYDQDLNLYAYGANDPMNARDFTGRDYVKLYDPHQAAGFWHVSGAFIDTHGHVYAYEFTGWGQLRRYNLGTSFRVDVDRNGNITPSGVQQLAEAMIPRSAGYENRGANYAATVFPNADRRGAFLAQVSAEQRAIRENGGPRVAVLGLYPLDEADYSLCNNNCGTVANRLGEAAGAEGYGRGPIPGTQFAYENAFAGETDDNAYWTQQGNAHQDPRMNCPASQPGFSCGAGLSVWY